LETPVDNVAEDAEKRKRDRNYLNAEDETLCSAYLNVSKDPIVGASQQGKAYWTRITIYFNEMRKTPIQRSLSSLQHRWGDIQKDTSRFCGAFSEIMRRNESGKNEDDKVTHLIIPSCTHSLLYLMSDDLLA
jgi:hypothetical protein